MIFDIKSSLWKSDFCIFWRTVSGWIQKEQWFPLSILIFGQRSCFLGPSQLVLRKVNARYNYLHYNMTLVVEYDFTLYKIKQIFSPKKVTRFIRFSSFQNVGLGKYFLLKTFFDKLNFWTPIFSKNRPSFVSSTLLHFKKKVSFKPCHFISILILP